MVPKVEGAWDIHYVDRLLAQLEAKAGLERPILVHAILETAQGVVNLEEIATASPRMQGMSFGPADLAASRRMKTTRVGGGHPGYRVIDDPDPDDPEAPRATAQQDLWHYSIARMVDACTCAGILPFYGPYGDIKDTAGCEAQFRAAFLLGCVGAWSLHPAQIEIAKRVFSPDPDEVAFAKKVIEAIPDGRGVHMIDGKMQDDATWKQCKVMVDLAEQLAAKDPELAEAYGFAPRLARGELGFRAAMRFFEYEAREIVKRAGIPVTDFGFATSADEAREIAERIGGPTVIKSQVLTGGRMKAGGVKFADTPDEAAEHAEDDPGARDQRPHAARRAGRPQGRGQAGVLRGRRLGRHAQAPGDDLLARWAASTSSRSPRSTPTRSGRRHFSTLLPFSDFMAKEVDRLHRRHRPRAEPHSRRSWPGWRSSSSSAT